MIRPPLSFAGSETFLDPLWLSVRSVATTGVAATGAVLASTARAAITFTLAGPFTPLLLIRDEGFHQAVLWVVAPAAALAFSTGCLQHKDRAVFLMGGVGMSLLFASVTFAHDLIGETGERLLTIFSASLLIAAHVRNFRLCRRDVCAHDQG